VGKMSQGKRKQVPYVLGQAWGDVSLRDGSHLLPCARRRACVWGEPTAGRRAYYYRLLLFFEKLAGPTSRRGLLLGCY